MKPLASRTDALRQSDIRAITFAVNEHGGVNLGQGICDQPTPEAIREGAKRAIDAGRSLYTAYNGIQPLRESIAEKARTFNGIDCDESQVVVSVGSTGAFVSTVLALCEAGDEVILFQPFYGYHSGILRLHGVTPVAVPLAPPGGAQEAWAVDLAAVEAAVTEKTKAVLICTPANPTGKVWTREELAGVLEIATRHDLWCITDEIYEHMTYDGREHVSLASMPGAAERTVTLSGFSKTFNMTGWRLGYAIAPPEASGVDVAQKMGLVNDLLYICAPAPLQYGLEAALPMPDSYYAEMLADYTAKRTLMCDTLAACGFEVTPPEGAYYVLAGFRPLADRPGFADDSEAAQTLIEGAGVGCVPGNSFFAAPEDGRYFLRFCYAKEMDVLEDACRRLRAFFA
ncbi:pyridoxal phosphate-dependent aminotransferase [Rubricoccus marinus]|uniref:Aminotransferase n=1 Tax=Rubricoccus marinus TaxID=716817 RepID=A0A259U3K0_9BACT|nr:pyridoxal phosphate-dependent aminotransferase [Rubricoccus marinus]OZC04404.1 aspartate aminotransferase [Rubricoccus marinus]